MNTFQYAFASAIGTRSQRIARTLAAAHPLRRAALARRLGASGCPLDNAALRGLASAPAVRIDAKPAGYGRVQLGAAVLTLRGLVVL